MPYVYDQCRKVILTHFYPELGTCGISLKPIPYNLFLHQSYFKSLPRQINLIENAKNIIFH